MDSKHIYLGIDSRSNLSISLEPACQEIFFISIREGTVGRRICKFAFFEDALDAVLHDHPVKLACNAGELEISSSGDEVTFHFRRDEDKETSSCTLSVASLSKVMRTAHDRAYAM